MKNYNLDNHIRSNLMKSSVRILKFGGTSVGSGERIRHVATIIAQHAHDPEEDFPVVVVSAMAGVTDQLLRIAHYSCTGQLTECVQELSALKQKHPEAAEKAVHNSERLQALHPDLDAAFTALERDVSACLDDSCSPRDVPLDIAAVGA